MSSEQPPSNHSNSNNNQKKPRWIWFITGPTACGKTTVAKSLAQSLGFSFVEGDDVSIPPSPIATNPTSAPGQH